MRTTVKIETDRGDAPFEIEVELAYHPGENGGRDGFGAPAQPDVEPEFEIIEAYDEFGTEFKLTETEKKMALAAACGQ